LEAALKKARRSRYRTRAYGVRAYTTLPVYVPSSGSRTVRATVTTAAAIIRVCVCVCMCVCV
jgi:hypothetical protein